MKQYYKQINGNRVWFDGVLKINGKQIINPSKELILSAGYIEYVPPTPVEPTPDEQLKSAIHNKIQELKMYDGSEDVNDCIIIYQGTEIHYWANKQERDALKGAVRDCITIGRDTYRLDLRDKGISMLIPCEKLLQMLVVLEVYAIDCYNKTTDHEFAINACTSIQEVDEYLFTIGYPEKLTFNI